jgi:hypothetical protein
VLGRFRRHNGCYGVLQQRADLRLDTGPGGLPGIEGLASFASTNEIEQTVSSLATASFADFLTLSSTGSPTSIDFNFTITGTGLSGSTPSILLIAFTSSMPGGPLVVTSGAGAYTLTSNWAPALVLQAVLQAQAQFDNGAAGPWSGGATADFFSTATLTSIVVYDGVKDITDTVNITGGAPSYPLGGSEVPEPSTLLVTAGATAAVLFARKRVRA